MKIIVNQLEQLPDVVRDSPDMMYHDDVFEVVQHLINCPKGIAVAVVAYAMTNKCTVMDAVERLRRV